VKPFCRFYERETAAYCLLRGIEYVYDECPFSTGTRTNELKSWLNRLEEDQPGLKLNFYLSYLRARQNGLFPESVESKTAEEQVCPRCGSPTITGGLCAFCRLMDQINDQTVSR
jgi:uncharacterized protein (TIGR00269 family)